MFRKEQQQRDSEKAMAEYQAELVAQREKTARLRALRLARDAAGRGRASAAKPAASVVPAGKQKQPG